MNAGQRTHLLASAHRACLEAGRRSPEPWYVAAHRDVARDVELGEVTLNREEVATVRPDSTWWNGLRVGEQHALDRVQARLDLTGEQRRQLDILRLELGVR